MSTKDRATRLLSVLLPGMIFVAEKVWGEKKGYRKRGAVVTAAGILTKGLSRAEIRAEMEQILAEMKGDGSLEMEPLGGQETGDGGQEAGDRRQESGDRSQETDSPVVGHSSPDLLEADPDPETDVEVLPEAEPEGEDSDPETDVEALPAAEPAGEGVDVGADDAPVVAERAKGRRRR